MDQKSRVAIEQMRCALLAARRWISIFARIFHSLKFDSRNLDLGKLPNAERKHYSDFSLTDRRCCFRTIIRCRMNLQRKWTKSNNNQLIRTTMQMFCDCFCCFLFTSKNGFMVSMTTTRLFRIRKNENMPKQSTDASFFSRKCCASAIAWSLLSSPPNRLFCIFFYLLLIDLKMRSNRISTTFRARIMSNSLSELGPQTLQI